MTDEDKASSAIVDAWLSLHLVKPDTLEDDLGILNRDDDFVAFHEDWFLQVLDIVRGRK